jgi:hypothetical protein
MGLPITQKKSTIIYMSDITKQAFDLSMQNLLRNQTTYGFAAARPGDDLEKGTYASLFSRDVGVCTLGALMSGNPELIEAAKKSLISLTMAQSERGQFPQNYVPEKHEIHWWIPGGVDGTIWWAIAFLKYYEYTKDETFYNEYKDRLEKAFTWLKYQDTNNDYLVEQAESSGWDDEMPRQGIVLYTNAIWFWLVKLRVEIEGREDLRDMQERIREGINTILWVHKGNDTNMAYLPKNRYTEENVYAHNMMEISNAEAVFLPYYLGYQSHKTFEMRCDVFGNILACLTGVADAKKADLFVDFVFRSGINLPYPVKVLYPPIYPGEDDWRDYMAKGRQNYPWQYHNGGIWPFIGGFWVMLLAQMNHPKAQEELEKLAKANELNDWEFNEYLHGQHGTPMGVLHQSWNMAMYVAAHTSLDTMNQRSEKEAVPPVSMEHLKQVRDSFLKELHEADTGKETSLPFIKHQLADQSIVQDGEEFQVLVVGGTVSKNVLVKKVDTKIQILDYKEGTIPVFKTKDEFLNYIYEQLRPNIRVLALNFAHAMKPEQRDGKLDGIFQFGAKEHTLDGLQGLHVGRSVEEYLAGSGRKIEVAVANDTICLLMSGVGMYHWNHYACGIVGTGNNFAMFVDERTPVNLESGEFKLFQLSTAAQAIDQNSDSQGGGLFEKETAGAYLYQHFNEQLKERGMTEIKEIHSTKELDLIAADPNHPAQELAQRILEYSAAMIATQVSGILEYHKSDMVFNMLGSLFWKGYRYKESVERYVRQLSPKYVASFTTFQDSEIFGAARLVT